MAPWLLLLDRIAPLANYSGLLLQMDWRGQSVRLSVCLSVCLSVGHVCDL